MTDILEKKNIILGISGGIAAYKSVELLRLLIKQGADVRVLMTRNACRFVGPLTFEALSGKAVCTHLFQEGQNASIGHIEWAKDAAAVIVAPATANIIGKMAGGIADDALTTFLLAAILMLGSFVAAIKNQQQVSLHVRMLMSALGILLIVPVTTRISTVPPCPSLVQGRV